MQTSVLIVIDDRNTCYRLLRALKRLDLAASAAHDGPAALQLIEQHRPRVVVVDQHLPLMDGAALVRRIRSRHPGTIVIALAGRGDVDGLLGLVREGCDDVLPAPLDGPAALVASIQRCLARRRTAPPAAEAADPMGAWEQIVELIAQVLREPLADLAASIEYIDQLDADSSVEEVKDLLRLIKDRTAYAAGVVNGLDALSQQVRRQAAALLAGAPPARPPRPHAGAGERTVAAAHKARERNAEPTGGEPAH